MNNKTKAVVGLTALGLFFSMQEVSAFSIVEMSSQDPNNITLDSRNISKNLGFGSEANNIKLNFGHNAYNLRVVKQNTDKKGKVHTRYNQTYKGIPVWGRQLIQHKAPAKSVSLFSSNHTPGKITGQLVTNLELDLNNQTPADGFTDAQALSMAKELYIKEHNIVNIKELHYENETSNLVVYTHTDDGKAVLAYDVNFFVDVQAGGAPARPSYLIDARTKKVIKKWNALMHNRVATGPGGNEKVGKYEYGNERSKLDVREATRGECFMTNPRVRTVDLKHGYYGAKTFHFPCFENNSDAVNGAYSPLNDAHYYGEKIFDMYQEWYERPPLDFKLVMRVHYGKSYENAFWNGSSMTFGDGRNYFYPLVSMDVAAHEISHGFTEQNSNLEYYGQSGGMNEAFSDIAGQAGEYYIYGKNSWMIGSEITKGDEPLRYLDTPEKDKISIGDARDYNEWLDVHYSSGVFNKAFYVLATNENWSVKKAFDVFVHANIYYWTSMSTFTEGALGAVYSAEDLGYDPEDVKQAFMKVGIGCTDDACSILPEDREGRAKKSSEEDTPSPSDTASNSDSEDADDSSSDSDNTRDNKTKSKPNNNKSSKK